ncbi:hypothetical protein RFI_27056, partial [Reticulomyxa filosa]
MAWSQCKKSSELPHKSNVICHYLNVLFTTVLETSFSFFSFAFNGVEMLVNGRSRSSLISSLRNYHFTTIIDAFVNVQTHVALENLPSHLYKKVLKHESYLKRKHKQNLKFSPYEKTINDRVKKGIVTIKEEIVNYNHDLHNDLIVGAPVQHQYRTLALNNIRNMLNRHCKKTVKIALNLKTNVMGLAQFMHKSNEGKPSKAKKLPEASKKVMHLWTLANETNKNKWGKKMKDSFTSLSEMPYLVLETKTKKKSVELLIYRDLKADMKGRVNIRNVISTYQPDVILLQNCGRSDIELYYQKKFSTNFLLHPAYRFSEVLIYWLTCWNQRLSYQFGHWLQHLWNLSLFYTKGVHLNSFALNQVISNRFVQANNTPVICCDLVQEEDQFLETYASWDLLYHISYSLLYIYAYIYVQLSLPHFHQSNHHLTPDILYLLSPYLLPHSYILAQFRNNN